MSAFAPNDPSLRADRLPGAAGGPARRARDRKRRGADAVVQVLAEAGVGVVFGLPGGAISPLADALLDEPRLRTLVMRHEATATFAACGYALQKGTVGVAYVTSGPGATNAVTGVASAYCDGIPLVLLVGEVPRAVQGKGALQDGSSTSLNLASVLRPITKATWEVTDAGSLSHTVSRALRLAQSGRMGPVAILMPLDVQLGQTIDTRVTAAVSESYALDEAVMRDVVTRVARAERPVLFAGNGVRGKDSAAALRAFAEHTGIPVITTPKGKGVFPERHPLSLGVFGPGGHISARRTLEDDVDCLIALGTRFGDLSSDGFSSALYPSRSLIHVDIDGGALAKNYAADVGIVAPAHVFLDDLRARLPARAATRAYGIERQSEAATHPLDNDGRVSSARMLLELQRALPDDTIFTVDSGEHTVNVLHWLEVDRPECFMSLAGLGSMGASTGVAIGAALARPDRRVCVVMGDGGFLMVGADIADAAALGLDIVFCVMNDGALRMCELGHHNIYGRAPSFKTPAVDVVATSLGLGAASAHRLTSAVVPDLSMKGVHVLDVQVDTSVVVKKRDRVAAMQKVG